MQDDRLSIERHTKVFCVTPKETFDTTSTQFEKGKNYFSFGINLNSENSTKERTLIFDEDFNYVLYSPVIAKRYFEYVRDYPIKPSKEEYLLNELYQVVRIKF